MMRLFRDPKPDPWKAGYREGQSEICSLRDELTHTRSEIARLERENRVLRREGMLTARAMEALRQKNRLSTGS